MKRKAIIIGIILLAASVLLTVRPDILGFKSPIPFNGFFFFIGLLLLVVAVALD